MKNIYLTFLSLLAANMSFAVATIPGSDPFINTSGSAFGTALNGSGDWISYSSATSPGYIASGDYVEFYGTGVHTATWNAFPSYNQDFTVSLGVGNYHTSTGGYADLGLRIYDSDGLYGDYISNIIGSYFFAGAASRDIMTYNGTSYTNALQFAQAATLSLDYDSSLKTFSAGYSYLGGPVTTFQTINIDGGVSNSAANQSLSWGMTDASVFEIAMVMASDEGPAAGSLLTTVDNFSVVPEPSTYALITGILAFCVIAYRRKK